MNTLHTQGITHRDLVTARMIRNIERKEKEVFLMTETERKWQDVLKMTAQDFINQIKL